MIGYRGVCQIHGEYQDIALCPRCIQEMFDSMVSTAAKTGLTETPTSLVQKADISAWEELAKTNEVRRAKKQAIYDESMKGLGIKQYTNPFKTVGLGRLEDNTQEDREFLQACGITAD